MVHRELHERLVINQERPFTTIPEAMMQIDTELSNLEDSEDELKEQWQCGECLEIRIDDARVEAGMKCGVCAYG